MSKARLKIDIIVESDDSDESDAYRLAEAAFDYFLSNLYEYPDFVSCDVCDIRITLEKEGN